MAPVDCIICSKAVKTGYSIKCQKCAQWLHRVCANVSIDKIKNLDKELRLEKGKRFYCSICVPQSPKRHTRKAGLVDTMRTNYCIR
nr:unnamed protein product [Callosobruchus analis]